MTNEALYRDVFKTVCSINFPTLTFERFAADVEKRMAETGREETRANVKKTAVELARTAFPKGRR